MTAPDPQALRGAGCGRERHASVIPWTKDTTDTDAGVVITPCFGWHPDARPALLCTSCRAGLRHRRRVPRRAP